jgi:hypothetical protein
MPFRFQRRIRLLPNLRVNLSKSGVSASVGTRGAWLTFGRRGTRGTVGIPGTGVSYTTQTTDLRGALRSRGAWFWVLLALLVAAAIIYRALR